jgi:hypothetical protein
MADPSALPDEDGEWLELYNRRENGSLQLEGCAIDDGSSSQHLIRAPFSLAAGAYATIARSEQPAFRPDVVLSFSLANSADSIALSCDDIVIDRVAYDASFPRAPGSSLSLDPGSFDPERNDQSAAWCSATAALESEFGTPGSPNSRCAADSAGVPAKPIAQPNTKPKPSPSSTPKAPAAKPSASKPPAGKPSAAKPAAPKPPAAPKAPPDTSTTMPSSSNPRVPRVRGQVVISEFMSDPSAFRDDQGEWIELHNPGGGEVDLQGCAILDGSATRHPIKSTLPIAAGGYVVIARAASDVFASDLVLDFSLANSADTIGLQCGDVEIDRIDYDSAFPLMPGVTAALDRDALTATENDDAAHWCAGTKALGSEFGTPGSINASCSASISPMIDAGSAGSPIPQPMTPDAGVDPEAVSDAGSPDAGVASDAATALDAGMSSDAGDAGNAAIVSDAGAAGDAGAAPTISAATDAGPGSEGSD